MLPHFYNPTNGDYCRRQQLFAHCAWSLSDAAGQIATGAIGTIHLLAQDGAGTQREQDAKASSPGSSHAILNRFWQLSNQQVLASDDDTH